MFKKGRAEMDIAIIICSIVIIFMLVIVIAMMMKLEEKIKNNKGAEKEIDELKKQIEFINRSSANHSRAVLEQSAQQSELIVRQITVLGDSLRNSMDIHQKNQHNDINERLAELESDFDKVAENILTSLENIRRSNYESMEKIRAENQESLNRINDTVNDKLQKSLDDRISKSFEAVNKRLTEVYEGLGEMKNVASAVSDLKNVLSNVKTRGIMGEIQLGAILGEILAPEQYCEQTALVPRSAEKVDFAVKLPGTKDDECVYLPIDSKFPADTYSNLLNAYESGNPELLKTKRNLLIAEIKRCAKSIHDKYIRPPYTTDFAIMFLPFEGLYAEVVNLGLVEVLQREYRINIAGPSTMGAMLNSLQMGFRTLAIQKKSSEVWKILESAKKEFGNFEDVLNKTRDRLRQADEELGKLIGTRTNKINSALKNVTVLDDNSES
ncbi:MAG: DNA recombination protein RmuC [Ruminococcus sp.]|nr:DNA recombination protein RmuC [Ruminococcus sp.]